MSIKKIVLTGGPCGGKSTALESIKNHLLTNDYNVIVINESATELINSGIKPFGDNKISNYDFQEILLNYQLTKERLFSSSNFSNTKDTVILYDRGIIDSKAYLKKNDFLKLLKHHNLNEISLLDNYDLVIYLTTAAIGAEEFYTLSNNRARTESIEEAIEKDFKTKLAWLGHDDLRIVTNDTDFNTKLEKVNNIVDSIATSQILKRQKKYLLDSKYVKQSLNGMIYNKCIMEQQYFEIGNDVYKVRKKELNNFCSYSLSLERLIGNNQKIILDNFKLTERLYYKYIKDNYDFIKSIKKERITFIYDNHYFKLDILTNGLCILETIDYDKISNLEFLPIVDDVTNQDKYYNYELAKKLVR